MSFLKEGYPDLMWDGEEKLPLIVSFGAGVDSTAVLVEMHNRGIRPDYIIFADTGAERPDIYAHIERVNKWLRKVGFPVISIVSQHKAGKSYKLIDNVHQYKAMPSLAYGFKSCSVEYKIRPVELFIKANKIERNITVIGYGVGEIDRAIKALEAYKKLRDSKKRQSTKDRMKVMWFPLIDWKLNRSQCKELSRAVGFCTSKSSCFFCPSMNANEVLKLAKAYPELVEQAIEIERVALEEGERLCKERTIKAVEVFGKEWFRHSKEEFKAAGIKMPRTLTVKGEHVSKGREFIHRGISTKKFKRTFRLSEHVNVNGADIQDGILAIELQYIIPESMRPRKINIGQTGKQNDTSNTSSPQLLNEGS